MQPAKLLEKPRLIVLLPESLAGDIKLAHHIYRMAGLQQRDVLYLVLVEDEMNQLEVSRRMATMTAATIGETLRVHSRLASRGEWLDALRQAYQPGDSLVCQAEQSVRTAILRTESVQNTIQRSLQIPVSVLSGFYHPARDQIRLWLFSLLFWLGCLVILAGFTLLEIEISHSTQGPVQVILISIALLVEYALLYIWNRLPKI